MPALNIKKPRFPQHEETTTKEQYVATMPERQAQTVATNKLETTPSSELNFFVQQQLGIQQQPLAVFDTDQLNQQEKDIEPEVIEKSNARRDTRLIDYLTVVCQRVSENHYLTL